MKLTADLKFRHYLLLVVLFITTSSQASFEPLPVGGRAAGMGEAYTAMIDDVFSLYYNPAGVLQIERPEIGSYYSQLYMGLSDNSQISRTFVGYAQPFGKKGRLGGIGASYLALDLPGLYREEAIGVTYGREMMHRYNVGFGLKMLRKQIGTDVYSTNAINPLTGNATGSADPVLAGSRSASALGLDLGLQCRLTRVYALGVAMRNINSPDIALKGSGDKAPGVISLALARRLRGGSLNVEATNWKGATNNTRFAIGGEHWFKNGFALRAGGGLGSGSYSTLSFGASYKMDSFQIDYASILPLGGIQGTLGTQQVSLTVRLGKPPVDPMEAQLMKEKEERIKAETEARNAKAERDRLKSQLMALTESKTQQQKNQEAESARQALEELKKQAVQRDRETKQTAPRPDTNLFSDYTAAVADYNEKVRQGLTLEEKEALLQKITNKFEKSGLDLATVKREIKSLDVEKARSKRDYELSMNFYQRLVQQGASSEERRGMLQRIIQKYKGGGVDIKSAEEEMRLLTK